MDLVDELLILVQWALLLDIRQDLVDDFKLGHVWVNMDEQQIHVV